MVKLASHRFQGIAGRSNIERPTSNFEGENMNKQIYDLEERLLEYSVRIIKIVEQLPNTRVGNHVAGQLLKSGTSPYPNHGEAQAAESTRDFIHKLRIALKELRETQRWLKLIQRVPLLKELNY
jgi:four helix bundle protein